MVLFVIAMLLSGLVVGALGRLVVPGPNPMSVMRTTVVGLAGMFLGGLVGRLALGWRYRYSALLGFVLAVLCSAAIVWALEREQLRRGSPPTR
jgi:uncharacterized membrane protein YeaQ/YmgE (transglycosylase-associated protein family)